MLKQQCQVLRQLKFKQLVAVVGCLIISSCSKELQPISSCISQSAINQLQQTIWQNLAVSQNKSISLTLGTPLASYPNQAPSTQLSCRILIRARQLLAESEQRQFTLNYQLNSAGQLNLNPDARHNLQQLKQWIMLQPNLVSQTQLNSKLSLRIIALPGQELEASYLNHFRLNFPQVTSSSHLAVDKVFNVQGKYLMVISGYFGSSPSNLDYHSYALVITTAHNYQVLGPFNYQAGSLRQNNNQISFNGLKKYSFADSGDYPRYQITPKQIILIKDSYPLSYYAKKFSHYSAGQILQQIKSDGCLNGDQFYLSDICSRKINGYCFKLSVSSTPKPVASYRLLKSMCQSQNN